MKQTEINIRIFLHKEKRKHLSRKSCFETGYTLSNFSVRTIELNPRLDLVPEITKKKKDDTPVTAAPTTISTEEAKSC